VRARAKKSAALQASDARLSNQVAGVIASGVRRLTPLECERLQGFPDGWTATTADGRPISDSHRYRMLGNAVATPVAQWLGHRLAAVDALDSEKPLPAS
jgi:DNA (cytosine-5)-methyltransferase 1